MNEIEYFEEDGKLHFYYEEWEEVPTQFHAESYKVYEVSGTIPDKIVEKGNETIRKYVEHLVKQEVATQKREWKKRQKFLQNPDFPVEVWCDGICLKGRIVNAEDSVLTVRLDSPKKYSGEHYVIYGFGAAVAGKYIFDKDGWFTQNAVESAERLLVKIYRSRKGEKKFNLDELNG